MDKILKELFGGGDEPESAPVAATGAQPAATAAATPKDPDREARREARRSRRADPDRRRKRDEFVERYTTGLPSEGFTAEEAIEHLREMREEMSAAEFRVAMQKTLEHLPSDQRDEFIAMMRQHQAATPAAPGAAAAGSRAVTADPFGGLLTGLMGGATGGTGGVNAGGLFQDLTKGGLRAPSATPGQQPSEADFHALLDSPVGRAVLGGVAAHGMQGMQADDDDHDTPGGMPPRG